LCPDGAQLGHDLTVHRSDLAAFDGHGDGRVAQNGLFDTKTLATNRHEFFPPLQYPSVLDRRDLTSGSRRNISWCRFAGRRTPTINHQGRAFIQNKRYRANSAAIDDVVNRNAVFVYQTD